VLGCKRGGSRHCADSFADRLRTGDADMRTVLRTKYADMRTECGHFRRGVWGGCL